MTTGTIQPSVKSPQEIASMMAGLEAEVRRAHTMIATERLERQQALVGLTAGAPVDLSPILARMQALEGQQPGDLTTAADVKAVATALLDAANEQLNQRKRIDELEKIVYQIGQQFALIAERAAA